MTPSVPDFVVLLKQGNTKPEVGKFVYIAPVFEEPEAGLPEF